RDPARGRRQLERSLALALERNFEEHAARSYTNLGCFLVYDLDYVAARRMFEDGIAYCIERDLDTWRDYMGGWRAEVL
ncbi:hypothetical protein OFM21_34440, partial [Escherichia coli]|nr:hypothetical protein [Escherichia coli]